MHAIGKIYSSLPKQGEAIDGLFDDLEVQIHLAVLQRKQSSGSFPDGGALEAMEEPLHRLMGTNGAVH